MVLYLLITCKISSTSMYRNSRLNQLGRRTVSNIRTKFSAVDLDDIPDFEVRNFFISLVIVV